MGEEGGINNLIKTDQGIRSSIYTFKNMMTNKTLSKMFNFPYKDLDLIITLSLVDYVEKVEIFSNWFIN